jgi:hypothetical protein
MIVGYSSRRRMGIVGGFNSSQQMSDERERFRCVITTTIMVIWLPTKNSTHKPSRKNG